MFDFVILPQYLLLAQGSLGVSMPFRFIREQSLGTLFQDCLWINRQNYAGKPLSLSE